VSQSRDIPAPRPADTGAPLITFVSVTRENVHGAGLVVFTCTRNAQPLMFSMTSEDAERLRAGLEPTP